MQVHVVAAEEKGRLVPERHRLSIPALCKVQLDVGVGELGSAGVGHGIKLLELLRHDPLVHNTRVVQLRGAHLVLGHLLAKGKGRKGGEGERVLHDCGRVLT